MAVRLGPGPVFFFEWLRTSRRWQMYTLRSAFVAALGAGLGLVWWSKIPGGVLTISRLAVAGEQFFYALVGTQLAVALLVSPAYTAGAVCLDKTRGTMLHLLVTDLSGTEIILGKLAARLVPVAGLVFCSLPVLFVAVLLGGVDPEAVLGAFLVTVGVALLGGTLALTLSVWGRKTYEVLLATYLIWALVLLGGPAGAWAAGRGGFSGWEDLANPFWLAFLPYVRPGVSAWPEQLTFLGVAAGASALLAWLAVLRVRAVAVGQAGRPVRGPRRVRGRLGRRWNFPGVSLDRNPVLWREWYRGTPGRWSRAVWLVYAGLATLFSVLAIVAAAGSPRSFVTQIGAAFVNGFQVSLGLLLVSVGAVTPLADDRAHGRLDLLLTTPLPTRSIVWGKWWGAYRRVPLLAFWPALVTAACTWERDECEHAVVLVAGLVLAYGAAVTGLGLLLATWCARPGRAMAFSVAAYVLVTAGWFFLILVLKNDSSGAGPAAGSPFYGTMYPVIFLERGGAEKFTCLAWMAVWTAVYAAAAALALAATLATFDRCVGRVGSDKVTR